MVGWEQTFTIVIAPGGTLSIDTWKPGDDEAVFSPPRSTLAPDHAPAAVRRGLHLVAVTFAVAILTSPVQAHAAGTNSRLSLWPSSSSIVTGRG